MLRDGCSVGWLAKEMWPGRYMSCKYLRFPFAVAVQCALRPTNRLSTLQNCPFQNAQGSTINCAKLCFPDTFGPFFGSRIGTFSGFFLWQAAFGGRNPCQPMSGCLGTPSGLEPALAAVTFVQSLTYGVGSVRWLPERRWAPAIALQVLDDRLSLTSICTLMMRFVRASQCDT